LTNHACLETIELVSTANAYQAYPATPVDQSPKIHPNYNGTRIN